MNIQKSRLASIIGLVLMVCMIFGMMVVPASAATIEVPFDAGMGRMHIMAAFVYEQAKADLMGYSTYSDLAVDLGYGGTIQCWFPSDGTGAFLYMPYVDSIVKKYNTTYPENPIISPEFPIYYNSNGVQCAYLQCPDAISSISNLGVGIFYRDVADPEPHSSAFSFLSESDLWHLMDEIKGILPAVVQALVGYIAIRKGIEFLQWCMNRA